MSRPEISVYTGDCETTVLAATPRLELAVQAQSASILAGLLSVGQAAPGPAPAPVGGRVRPEEM